MSGMTTHDLKTHPEPFKAVWAGTKLFEFRKNDRGFKVGDSLNLREWDPKTMKYSGMAIMAKVTYILKNGFGLPENYCILSLDPNIMRSEMVLYG